MLKCADQVVVWHCAQCDRRGAAVLHEHARPRGQLDYKVFPIFVHDATKRSFREEVHPQLSRNKALDFLCASSNGAGARTALRSSSDAPELSAIRGLEWWERRWTAPQLENHL